MATLVDRFGPEGALAQFTDAQLAALPHLWEVWARPEQLAPGTPNSSSPRVGWLTWLILAGRGWGKSRTGAEWVRHKAQTMPGSHGALVARSAADGRDVMVKALLACSPASEGLTYEPSNRLLRWANSSTATVYSAETPDQLRGPQHHWAWCDELAAWQYPQDAWDNLQFGLRLGDRPQVVVTTTPRPIKLVRQLLADDDTVVTRGATRDNRANLAAPFIKAVEAKYAGTRLGRQELDGEVLDDTPGALWTRKMLDDGRLAIAPELTRIVVAIDPAVTSHEGSDETGIVVAGLGRDRHIYVLADISLKGSTDTWARVAVDAYKLHEADRIVAEVNNGGDLVERVIKAADKAVAYKAVRASRGKLVRAEPVSMLYEQGRVHHVGCFPALEDQMCTFVPGAREGSPDRVDALVWACTELMGGAAVSYFPDDDGWVAPRFTF